MRQGRPRSIACVCATAVLAVVWTLARGSLAADATPSASAAAPTVVTAPAFPQVVIQGGELPKGWTPKPVPYAGIGPDGKPVTVLIAPTYTFTFAAGPPVPMPVATVTATPPRAAGSRSIAAAPAPRPSVPYGTPWVFQTQGLQPVDAGIVVAKPYELPKPPSQWVAAPFPSTPPEAVAAAPLQPPPSQWIPASEPPATMPMAPVAAAPAGTQGAEVLASMAPAAIAGGAAAAAPQPIPTSTTAANASASPSSLAPAAAPSTPPAVADASSPATHFWRVVGVHDGDTITCIDDTNTKQKVRLAEIDAPEIGQDFGKVSRDALAEMVFGKTVEVRDQGKDRYGRWIAHLFVDGTDVNRQMVATGNAWHYAAYSQDSSLAELQQQAQVRKLGLWSQPNPMPPWEYRKNGGSPTTTTRLDRRSPLLARGDPFRPFRHARCRLATNASNSPPTSCPVQGESYRWMV